MNHSPKGCGVVRHNQTEVLSPNDTVYVQGAGQSMGIGLMTVSSEQGPTTCHDLVRLSAFSPAQLFWILVTLGQWPLPVPIPHHTRSGDFPNHRSFTWKGVRHPQLA
jgi:hypothetical protein